VETEKAMTSTQFNPGVQQLWSSVEIAEIMHDSAAILADESLLVLSDGRQVRAPGHWELMRLGQRAMVLAGDVTVD
jgi:hypothetical protein